MACAFVSYSQSVLAMWHQEKARNNFTTIESIVRKSKHDKFWIYRRSSKKWYTPEEFAEWFADERTANPEDFLKDFLIADPIEGLRQNYSNLLRCSAEAEAFARKIANYYDP